MSIAIDDDHLELARIARQLLAKRGGTTPARSALDNATSRPSFWDEIAELGWLGLHVAEELGGSGFGLMETAVVAEELGRVCAPGPFLANVVAAAAIATAGTQQQRVTYVRQLVAGKLIAGITTSATIERNGSQLRADAVAVLSGDIADVLVVSIGDDLALLDRSTPGLDVEATAGLDPGFGFARLSAPSVEIDESHVVRGGAATLQHTLAVFTAAIASGGAAACREMAAGYAADRWAFGRPIGHFQAIKHYCANMLVNDELASAAVWNAARLDPSAAALPFANASAAEALAAFCTNAQLNIQVHGGIGYTWEHDAHLYLRRATSLTAFCGPLSRLRTAAATLSLDTSSGVPLDLPPEAEPLRETVRDVVATYWQSPAEDRHAHILDGGYLFPNWPPPWGRGAGPVEQIVIEEEMKGVPRMEPLGPTSWTLPINLPTILVHGSADQQARWIGPTMQGHLAWCQLMSEPGAGSDLAAVSTRGTRAAGGWLVTGQKVWTSNAHDADVGFALVRTDTDTKHGGITCMVVDMHAPGVTIRPLRQITGHAHFNEVFLDDVFVSDDDVIGAVNDGWRITRTSLGNERVSLGQSHGWAPPQLLCLVERHATVAAHDDPSILPDLGALCARAAAISALNLRSVARALNGNGRATDGNLTKLAVAEFAQAACELGVRVAGTDALFTTGVGGKLATAFLASRAATIAGGTSEIMRNVLAERVLGLPRDVDPTVHSATP